MALPETEEDCCFIRVGLMGGCYDTARDRSGKQKD